MEEKFIVFIWSFHEEYTKPAKKMQKTIHSIS